ncbi:MAG: DUF3810 domain-containing protein [Clostridia bacterium]|nr:DUF3810 domain-containing protein [Clostridia bacterium]
MDNNIETEVKVEEEIKEDKPEEKAKRRTWLGLPIFSWVFFGIAAFALIVMLTYIISEDFANFYNRYPAAFLRGLFAAITSIIPCSIAEAAIIFAPVLMVAIIIYANKRYTSSWREVGKFLLMTLSVASLFFSTFALNFGAGYHTSSVDKLLELERRDVSAEELRETAEFLASEINKYTAGLASNTEGSTIMPYGYDTLSEKLVEAYDKVCDEHEFISRFSSKVKPVLLSEPWTYTHIAGVYTYFTGESNINVNFPDYTIPYTAAHEMAHQRGIAREDEANFVAFLVCAASDDDYIRYSGYLNLYEYVSNALYRADKDAYAEVRASLDPVARVEMSAYSKFFDKYRENVAATVTETVNNTYLTIQGTPGTKSYGMVVDLAVAYIAGK